MAAAVWQALNPDVADYRAAFGAYVNGIALLEMPSGSVAVTGHCSAATRESAERIALKSSRHDSDRHISRATFDSWRII